MAKQRILFISPEIAPYLPSSENSRLGKELPTAIQSRKYEVRTFMPNFGEVNERRNQLHEVIRLSGINIPINDDDHPLIIKVASMQPSRIQVYFIDNDDYFQKLDSDIDAVGSNRPDNDERIIFFTRGTMETARKLRWDPDFFHASGWISSMIPLYYKTIFNDAGTFSNGRMIYSVLRETPTAPVSPGVFARLADEGVPADVIERLRSFQLDDTFLHRIGIEFADGVIFNDTEPDARLVEFAKNAGVPYIILDPEKDNADAYHEFYQKIGESSR